MNFLFIIDNKCWIRINIFFVFHLTCLHFFNRTWTKNYRTSKLFVYLGIWNKQKKPSYIRNVENRYLIVRRQLIEQHKWPKTTHISMSLFQATNRSKKMIHSSREIPIPPIPDKKRPKSLCLFDTKINVMMAFRIR
jgi:hypothetical protein